jgi:trk system potassium uptake protein TrkH
MPLADAFFTATSATYVAGLVVVDTGTAFSTFGQLVILACIQVGGLSLMTLTTVFVVLVGRRVAIAVQGSFHHPPTGNIRTLVKYVVVATLSVEAAGVGRPRGRRRHLRDGARHPGRVRADGGGDFRA